jgi:hypothetical protein
VLVWLLLSVVCSAITEAIAALLSLRHRELEEGVKGLLRDDGLVNKLYAHPLIMGLCKPNSRNRPAYIPSRMFALALLDTLAPVGADGKSSAFSDEARATIAALPDSNAKQALLLFLTETDGNLRQTRINIERWFDDTMGRVSGWYKRRTQVFVLLAACMVTLVLNVDSVDIFNTLSRDPVLRSSIVAAAQQQAAQQPTGSSAGGFQATISNTISALQQLSLPIGWFRPDGTFRGTPGSTGTWFSTIVGWVLTITAASLGAPFWFDMLNKLVNLRLVGDRPQSSAKTAHD